MGFLPKKWLRSLWGVTQPGTELAPPIDCAECRIERHAGRDACPEHHHHVRAHVYHAGHEINWGNPTDRPYETMPQTNGEDVSRISYHSIH